MSECKKEQFALSEEDLKKVSGGDGGMYNMWCPNCNKETLVWVSSGYFCTVCNKDITEKVNKSK